VGTLRFSPALTESLQAMVNRNNTWWIRNLIPNKRFPTLGSKEKATCQPFVTNVLRNFEGNTIQGTLWSTHFLSMFSARTMTYNLVSQVDATAYRNVSFSTRKPDVVAYEIGRRGVSSITMIGDVKGYSSDGDFDNEEVGHVLDMTYDLMNIQRFRNMIYCFLTDGYRFQYFRVSRNVAGNYSVEQSSVFFQNTGWKVQCCCL
jgi:hypothetical protein